LGIENASACCKEAIETDATNLGVISSVGKGIIASSTGLLLKTIGYSVTYIKIDPYMNIDAGTMAPTESDGPLLCRL
jgi:hypothetical protein